MPSREPDALPVVAGIARADRRLESPQALGDLVDCYGYQTLRGARV
jgi:hypothetical protein